MLCSKCGAIMDQADVDLHICNPFNVPEKGKIKQPKTTEVSVDGN
jgi:hypothetical protein